MRKSKIPIEDRLKQAEYERVSKELFNKAQIEKYNTTLISKLNKPVRVIFYTQVLLSLLAFLFFPFKSTDVISSYLYEKHNVKGSTFYTGYIETESGQSIVLNSQRLRETRLQKGDTIFIEKNLLLKTEGITSVKENKTYYTNAKWVWCFIWFFALIASIASSFFTSINDLKNKREDIHRTYFINCSILRTVTNDSKHNG